MIIQSNVVVQKEVQIKDSEGSQEGAITSRWGYLEKTCRDMAIVLSIGEMAFSWWTMILPILPLESKPFLKPDKLKDNGI